MSGVDARDAMEQLGHSDIKTTLGIYTHLDKEHKRRSMDKMEEYLNNACQRQSIVHNSAKTKTPETL